LPESTSFDQIYEELFPSVYRFVRLKIPINDIDDVASDIMVKVWKSLPNFEGKTSLKGWALKIAANQIADYYRTHRHKPFYSLTALEGLNQCTLDTDPSEKIVELNIVKQALSQLTEPQLTAIQLRLIEGFSAIEAAEILQTTPQAVDSLLYRAKKSFRQAYVTMLERAR